MPAGYIRLKKKFLKEGLSEKEAEKKAARIWNSQHPGNSVGKHKVSRKKKRKK